MTTLKKYAALNRLFAEKFAIEDKISQIDYWRKDIMPEEAELEEHALLVRAEAERKIKEVIQNIKAIIQ